MHENPSHYINKADLFVKGRLGLDLPFDFRSELIRIANIQSDPAAQRCELSYNHGSIPEGMPSKTGVYVPIEDEEWNQELDANQKWSVNLAVHQGENGAINLDRYGIRDDGFIGTETITIMPEADGETASMNVRRSFTNPNVGTSLTVTVSMYLDLDLCASNNFEQDHIEYKTPAARFVDSEREPMPLDDAAGALLNAIDEPGPEGSVGRVLDLLQRLKNQPIDFDPDRITEADISVDPISKVRTQRTFGKGVKDFPIDADTMYQAIKLNGENPLKIIESFRQTMEDFLKTSEIID